MDTQTLDYYGERSDKFVTLGHSKLTQEDKFQSSYFFEKLSDESLVLNLSLIWTETSCSSVQSLYN